MRFDAHVRIGEHRDMTLTVDRLLAAMDEFGIDRAMIAPSEQQIAYANRDGNRATTEAAGRSDGRLVAYAVATPWAGAGALEELERARDAGARALAVDSALQGFDLLDGMLDPLLERAAEYAWPVYVRTGSPPGHLPLPLAIIARRHEGVSFIMGRSGATDFWIDAAPALRRAGNIFADTSYAPWDTVLAALAADSEIGPRRLVFSTDMPYATAAGEIKRIVDWPLPDDHRDAIFGGTLAALIG